MFSLTPESAANKANQTRRFETPNSDELLSASAAVLQDLGFQAIIGLFKLFLGGPHFLRVLPEFFFIFLQGISFIIKHVAAIKGVKL